MRRSGLATLTGGLLLAAQFVVPGLASAVSAPLTVTADRPAAIPAGHLWGYNDFFPRTLTVHRGATVAFSIQGFHTATLAPAGVSANAVRASLGLVAADRDDATANPNGSTHTQVNLGAAFPIPGGCGSAASPCTYDGTRVVNSGAPLAGPVPDLNVRITAPVGTYTFLCLIHPRMQGRLTVVPDNIPATTPAQLDRTVSAQIHHDRAAGYAAEAAASVPRSRSNGDGTRTWFMTAGTGSRDGFTAVNEMLPRNVAIHRGDRVVWTARSVNEPHTITFPTDLHGDMVALCEGAGGDVPATPTVFPPTGPGDFSCNGGPPDEIEFDGGNGVNHVISPATVSDSGLVASRAELAGFSLPSTAAKSQWTVTFPANAATTTYTYVCQIHDGMAGTIVVH